MQRKTLTKKQQIITLTTFSVVLAAAMPSISVSAAVSPRNLAEGVNQITINNRRSVQIAQFDADCRRSSVQVPIAIRREPSFQSPSVAVLPRGTRVAIQNQGTNGWVPVYAPYQGYVYAGYLTACDTENPTYSTENVNTLYPRAQSSAAPALCRRVSAIGGLNVRPTPGITGTPVGVIANGSLVTIENPGQNGWVPITAPLQGFISANFLTVC